MLSLVSIYSKLHDHETKRLCARAVILPTNRLVFAQNWSLSWSKLALSKPGFRTICMHTAGVGVDRALIDIYE